MKRTFLPLIALLVPLAACGSDDAPDDSAAGTTEGTVVESASRETVSSGSGPMTTDGGGTTAAGDTRTVQDVFGQVEVPAEPERVVFMDNTGLGNALALGLPMEHVAGVAFDGFRDGNGYLEDEFGSFADIPDVGGGIYSTINVEEIAAQDPDLIILLGMADDEFSLEAKETLGATGVPVFAALNGYDDLDESMQLLADVGAALGREDEAAELEAGYRARVDETIAGLPEVRPSMNAVRVFAPNDVWIQAHWLMDDIGLPRTAPEPPTLFLDVSDEEIGLADADILFVSGDGGQEASLAALESNPLWSGLEAVQSGDVRLVDDQPWGTDYSYPALVIILDHIVAALEDHAAAHT